MNYTGYYHKCEGHMTANILDLATSEYFQIQHAKSPTDSKWEKWHYCLYPVNHGDTSQLQVSDLC